MDPNFDRLRRRFDDVPGSHGFHVFRSRYYRSSQGKLLGVFSGIAESRGLCVKKVRWIGVVTLLFLSMFVVDAHGIKTIALVCGFFYLLAALFMRSPRTATDGPLPPPVPPVPSRGGATPAGGMRPDFAQIDRQLDGLNRRIQRMETIVTDRRYDWERRMGS